VRLRSGGEEDRDAELGAFRPERVDDLGVRQRIGYRPAVLWFIVASERSGRRTRRPASRSPRRPAASDLVNQVEIGVEERGLPGSSRTTCGSQMRSKSVLAMVER
jgi:hypothetical protein